jgi:hypothetical protein
VTTLLAFPFDSGQREDAARQVLPDGLLREVRNMYLRRDGQLAAFPGDAQLANTCPGSATLTVDQLCQFREELCAIGRDTSAVCQRVFVYTGGTPAWSAGSRTEFATEVSPAYGARWLAQGLLGPGTGQEHTVAAHNGYVVSVGQHFTASAGNICIARAWAPDGTLLFEQRLGNFTNEFAPTVVMNSFPRVIWHDDRFRIIATAVATPPQILTATWRPNIDDQFTTPTVLLTEAGINAITDLDMSEYDHPTTLGTGFAIVYARSSVPTIIGVSYNSSGVQVAAMTVSGDASSNVAVLGCSQVSGADRIVFAWRVGTDVRYRAFTASTGVALWAFLTVSTTATSGTYPALGRYATVDFLVGATQAGAASTTEIRFRKSDIMTGASGVITFDHEDSALVATRIPVLKSPTGGQTRAQNIWRDALSQMQVSSCNVGTGLEQRWLQVADLDGAEQLAVLGARMGACCDFITGRTFVAVLNPIQLGGNDAVSVFRYDWDETAQHQIAETGGALYIAGALPSKYDGIAACEQAFTQTPVIPGTLTGTAAFGGLTPLGVYNYCLVWVMADANGDIHRSRPSALRTITLTGGQNTVDGFLGAPHTNYGMKYAGARPFARAPRCELYRTEAGGSIFRLAQEVVIPPQTTLLGSGLPVPFTDSLSDADLLERPTLYTEEFPENGQAPPHDFVWPGNDALVVAGMLRKDQWTRSQRLVLGEPILWGLAGDLQFSGRVPREIRAIAVKQASIIAFQRDRVDVIQGDGPDVSGQGEFFPSQPLLLSAGVDDWRAVIDTDAGLFFKTTDNRIYRMQGQGSAEWVSFPVADTLEAFPTVVGAVYLRTLNQVVFACNDLAGTGGRLLYFDLRRELWTVRTPISVSGNTALLSVSALNGALAYAHLQDRRVYTDSASSTRQLPLLKTGSLAAFDGLGYGALHRVGVLGEFRSACSLTCEVSLNDEATWDPIATYALTGSAGETFNKFFTPPRKRDARFVFRFTLTGLGTGDGAYLNKFLLEVDRSPGSKRAALGDSH